MSEKNVSPAPTVARVPFVGWGIGAMPFVNRVAAAMAPGEDNSVHATFTLAASPGLTPGMRKFRQTRRGRCQIWNR